MELNIKEIKKGCEFADGFEIVRVFDNTIRLKTYDNLFFMLRTVDPFEIGSLYKAFLQAVIGGINKNSYQSNGRYEIRTKRWGIDLKDYSLDWNNVGEYRYQELGIDKAKEQAIKYVLSKI